MESSEPTAGYTVVVLALYFLPAIIAFSRGHLNGGSIFVLNLLLGWTVLGWIVALVWCVSHFQKPTTEATMTAVAPRKSLATSSSAAFVTIGVVIAVGIFLYAATKPKAPETVTSAAVMTAPSEPESAPETLLAASAAKLEAPPPVALKPASPWAYSELVVDAMDDRKTKVGCTTSTNQVSLEWPYKNVTADLCVRRSPKFGLDVYVQLNGEGQILCGYSSCGVRIRFDKNDPRRFSGSDASDHSSNVIFINSESKVIASLKKSKKTVIEIEFYKAGVQALEFNTDQFEW